jgi:hypothetical protein
MYRFALLLLAILLLPITVVAQTPTSDQKQSTIAGTAFEFLPESDEDEVEVIAHGQIESTRLPVVVRNNTDEVVSGVVAKVEFRDQAGKLIGVSESFEFFGGLAPYFLNPGDLSIGYIYVEGEIPANAELEFSTRAGDPDDFMSGLYADIEFGEVNWVTDRLVGEAINASDSLISGVSLIALCFDADGNVTSSQTDTIREDIEAGGTASFQLSVYQDDCEHFLIAGTGTPED